MLQLWRFSVLSFAAIIIAACSTSITSAPPVGEPGPAGLRLCEDFTQLAAPAAAYRDHPIYVGNEQPTEELRSWAMNKPGFEEVWIDRDHNGWVALGFSRDAEARQQELESEFPGVGVVAVPLERTAAELQALQQRVHEVLPPDIASGSSAMTHYGVVMVMVGVRTPDRVAVVEAAFAGQPVCIDGIDPADAPATGPQRLAGDGWRLLANEQSGVPYRTGIAWDRPSLENLWANSGVTAEIPEVDFGREVVIWFGAVYGSSCPELRLDDVVIDGARRIIHGEIVVLDAAGGCTADANPRAFIVAVGRDRLPAAPFFIQLSADDPPGGVPEERTVVDADLRAPGSVAEPDQIHGDPNILQPRPDVVMSGDIIETGFPVDYRLSVHCGVEWLGTLNDVTWRASDPDAASDWIPAQWRQLVAMDQTLVLSVELSPGPDPRITATANDHSEIYEPAAEPAPGCD